MNHRILLAALVSSTLLVVPVLAMGGSEKSFTLTILSTNDTHGQPLAYSFSGALEPDGTLFSAPWAGGLPARKTYFDQVRSTNPNTLILDAGDVNTGNIVSNLFEAKPDVLGMNLAGYQAMTVGNHEFDVSIDSLLRLRDEAHFPFLSANIYVKSTGKRLLEPYTLVHLQDLTIAVIGLTTTETPTAVMPAHVADLEFRDPATEVLSLLPEVRSKADVVILLTHLGLEEDKALAARVGRVDLIIGGHSHTFLKEAIVVNGVPIFQAFTGGLFVGRVDVTVEKGKMTAITATSVPINLSIELKDGEKPRGVVKDYKGKRYDFPDGFLEQDPSVLALLQPFVDKVSADMDTVIATASGSFPHMINGLTAFPRRDDSALSNMLVDAMREATSERLGQKVDIFLQNGGGIRAPIPAGPVSKRTVYTVLPFDNTIVTAHMTGAQILKLLETKALPDAVANWTDRFSGPSGAFLQVSGLTYTLDLTAKTVSDVKVNGSGLEEARVYLMATQNFMMTGGDGFVVLRETRDPLMTSVFQRDAVIEWMSKKGVLDPSVYEDNRINLVHTGH